TARGARRSHRPRCVGPTRATLPRRRPSLQGFSLDLPRMRATIGLLVAALVKSTHLSVVPSLSKAKDASMGRIVGLILVLALGLSLAAGQEAQGKPATPAEQYKVLLKEWQAASQGIFSRAKTDKERNKMLASVDKFPLRFLELAEKYPKDPIALDALVHVVNLEISLENNTTYAGRGKEASPQARAFALLLRDHLGSDKLDYACWRTSYGV